MIKKYVLVLSIMFSTISFAQDKIVEFKNTLKTSLFYYAKQVIPIVNKENGEFSIFIAEPKKVYAYKFNDSFQIIGRLALEEKRRIYREFIGSSILDNGNIKFT